MAYLLKKHLQSKRIPILHRVFLSIAAVTAGLSGTVLATTQPPKVASTSGVSCALHDNKTAQLAQSTLPQLQKLAEYEEACSGMVTDTTMIFTRMPSSADDATQLSHEMAGHLTEFNSYNIQPLIILEPVTNEGPVNFGEYQQGKYDSYMQTYFQNLKTQGITDVMMGTWVPFPEPNIPEWDNTTIEAAVTNIMKTIALQKEHFPTSKASVLLNSMSYPPDNSTWNGGEYKSLIPYITNIPKGLVDSFGYQGFPWSPPQNEGVLSQANLSASNFLQSGLAIEAAKELGVTKIWLNTGSFSRSYANDPGQQVTVSSEKRGEILQSIIKEAQEIQNAGFTTAIHLFAEDKSAMSEGVDWSYWRTGQADSSPDTQNFKTFVATARESNFQFWLFDAKH